jgi:hypothetical protein
VTALLYTDTAERDLTRISLRIAQTILVLHDGSLNAFASIARIWRGSRIWGVLDRMFIQGSARWRTDHT